MTRETKIGLLVGLAFIIVIGILLSDHLTSSTEPPPAAIAQAGQAVRSAMNTPLGQAQQPPVTIIQPPTVQPQQQVPSANDLSPKPQPVTMVQIQPPAQDGTLSIVQDQSSADNSAITANTPPTQTPRTPARDEPTSPVVMNNQTNPGTIAPPRIADPMLARLGSDAARIGVPIVPVDESYASAPRKYKAEPGDSLSRIAAKHYGSGGKQYRDAIIAANPSLRENPDLIIEGRTYIIPAAATNANADSSTTQTPTQTIPTQTQTQAQKPPAVAETVATNDPNGSVYVVEEGDNLTRIAVDHVGSATAVAAIKELNRDILKGGDVIRPGMRLKLPSRSVAANN